MNDDEKLIKNNFGALLAEAASTFVYIKEKTKNTLPEVEINSVGSFQAIKDIVDMLCESVNKHKAEKEEALSALVAKNMLYDAALEQICKLRLK
jgi:hypothetical protein